MSSLTFQDTVTKIPAEWCTDVDRVIYKVLGNAQTNTDALIALGLGSISVQNSNEVSISGGSIDNTTIGANYPVQGSFSKAFSFGVITNSDVPETLVNKRYVDTRISELASADGVKSMAFQDDGSVSISGGALNNVRIGDSVPAVSGRFVSLDVISQGTNQTSVVLYGTIGSLATQNSNDVRLTGGSISGISATFVSLKSTATPSQPTDVITKSYADNLVSGYVKLDGSNLADTTVASSNAQDPANVGLVRSAFVDLTASSSDGSSYRVSSVVPVGTISQLPKLVSFPALKAYNDLKSRTVSTNYTFDDDTDIVVANTVPSGSIIISLARPDSFVDQRPKYVSAVIGNGSGRQVTVLLAGGATFADGSTSYQMYSNLESVQLVAIDNTKWMIV